jgi:hypothetical protein
MADEYEDSVPDSSKTSAEKLDKKDDTAQTALAPKSLFPEGVKPGYRCEIEVVSVHSDEIEYKKLPHKKEPSPSSENSTSVDDYS